MLTLILVTWIIGCLIGIVWLWCAHKVSYSAEDDAEEAQEQYDALRSDQ